MKQLRKPPPPYPAKPERIKLAHLTKRERIAMYTKTHGLCGCGCGERLRSWLGADAIGEHTRPLALGGSAKPDALYRPECAAKKTDGLRGGKSNIAKAKRIAEGRTQHDKRLQNGPKIKSRGFWGWLNFNGERVQKKDKKHG